jgi:hypothetical protein
MLQYRNAGISYQENSARIDTARASFASLPGELRNLTYASTLKWKNPITLTYDAATKHFQMPGVKVVDGRTPLQALELFSGLDHNIRTEARSHFFASNVFQLETKQSLENIGEVGRRSLRWLRLTINGDSKHHFPTLEKATKLWDLLGDCLNLVTLDLYAEIDYFYMDQQPALKQYLSTEGLPFSSPWPIVLSSIKQLPHLKRLVLRPVFSGRWRYFTVAVNGRMGALPRILGAEYRRVRFKVQRPIDEAERLSDQVKGHMRKGLRGKVNVRVLTTETWDLYGKDIVFGRDQVGTDEWGLSWWDIIKPIGRTFNYSNGLDN